MSTIAELQKQFDNDNNAMLAKANQVQADLTQSENDITAYMQKLKNPHLNEDYALILLFYILGASNQPSTLLGTYTDKSGVTGDRLALNGLLTKVNNDLNNFTQSDDPDPNTIHKDFLPDMNKVLDELNGTSTDPAAAGLNPNLTNPSMNILAEKSVFNELEGIRYEFYDSTLAYNPPTTDTLHFDVDPGQPYGYFTNFADFQKALGQQGDPFPYATKAAKTMTDNFGTNTQTTQTASAVLNNDQKTYTSMEQAINSCLASIAQWWSTQVKNVNSHMASGS